MKNWKTTLFGFVSLAAFVAGHFIPSQADFFNQLVAVAVGLGLISAKDHNVTGGSKEQ